MTWKELDHPIYNSHAGRSECYDVRNRGAEKWSNTTFWGSCGSLTRPLYHVASSLAWVYCYFGYLLDPTRFSPPMKNSVHDQAVDDTASRDLLDESSDGSLSQIHNKQHEELVPGAISNSMLLQGTFGPQLPQLDPSISKWNLRAYLPSYMSLISKNTELAMPFHDQMASSSSMSVVPDVTAGTKSQPIEHCSTVHSATPTDWLSGLIQHSR